MVENMKTSNSGIDIPDHAIESIARCLLSKIQQFYESDEGKRIFAEWKARREQENKDKA